MNNQTRAYEICTSLLDMNKELRKRITAEEDVAIYFESPSNRYRVSAVEGCGEHLLRIETHGAGSQKRLLLVTVDQAVFACEIVSVTSEKARVIVGFGPQV